MRGPSKSSGESQAEFPMRINRYLALKKYSTRRGADEIIKKKQVFINGRLAVLGDKVTASDVVEVKFRGKPTPLTYIAFNKPRGVAINTVFKEGEGLFPVAALDKDAHGLTILTNDGRVTLRLASPLYTHEKEYLVTTTRKLRSSFREKMEAGAEKVAILGENKFRITVTNEKQNQIRRMCAALFLEVADLACLRVMNIRLGNLKEGTQRSIEGDELKTFLKTLQLL